MRKQLRKGQSILEYTLVMGAVIAGIVAVLFGSGGFGDKVKSAYNKAGSALENTANDLNAGIFQ